MKSIGLDLSTSAGVALVSSPGPTTEVCLEKYFLVDVPLSTVNVEHGLAPEYSYVAAAKLISDKIRWLLKAEQPDIIAIEQTNLGKNRNDQKLLEFIHYAVLEMIREEGLYKRVEYVDSSRWRSELQIKMTKEEREHNSSIKKKTGKKIAMYRGKITFKHLSVKYVNQKYGLSLILKDNDIADAICLATWGVKKRSDSNKNVSEFDFDKDFVLDNEEE